MDGKPCVDAPLRAAVQPCKKIRDGRMSCIALCKGTLCVKKIARAYLSEVTVKFAGQLAAKVRIGYLFPRDRNRFRGDDFWTAILKSLVQGIRSREPNTCILVIDTAGATDKETLAIRSGHFEDAQPVPRPNFENQRRPRTG